MYRSLYDIMEEASMCGEPPKKTGDICSPSDDEDDKVKELGNQIAGLSKDERRELSKYLKKICVGQKIS